MPSLKLLRCSPVDATPSEKKKKKTGLVVFRRSAILFSNVHSVVDPCAFADVRTTAFVRYINTS